MAKALAGMGLGALIATGLLASPALFARDTRELQQPSRTPLPLVGGIGTFTPASLDPKLAAILARTGIVSSGFRFTPSNEKVASRQAQAPSNRLRVPSIVVTEASPAAVNLPAPAPIAYNLSPSSLSKRLGAVADLGRIEAPIAGGGIERLGGGNRKQALRAAIGMDRAIADTPRFSGIESIDGDAGGSVRLMRNLDVTAGMRVRSEKERMLRLDADRRDNQAVYVGTAFRF